MQRRSIQKWIISSRSDGLLLLLLIGRWRRGSIELLKPLRNVCLISKCVLWLSMEATLCSRLILFVYAAPPRRCLLLFFDIHHRRAAADDQGRRGDELALTLQISGDPSATDRTSRQSIDYCSNECVSKLWAAIYCCRLSWGSWSEDDFLCHPFNAIRVVWRSPRCRILAGSSHPCHTLLQLHCSLPFLSI
jgi:hypothetical protein